jgi:hexosaminidase
MRNFSGLVLALCMAALLGACTQQAARDAATDPLIPIIPAAAEVTRAAGSFEVTPRTQVRYVAGSSGDAVARYFVDLLERTRGIELPRRPGTGIETSGAGTIDFELRAGQAVTDDEGYSLIVSPERIAVSSRSSRGLFYGAVTLWQLLTTDAASTTPIRVPAITITDAPRFRWRGLLLDSARHFQSQQFIERLIDTMALHKLNVLHWHLTDDQAWRLEIEKYPRLTDVGAWRVPAGRAAAADIDPATGRPRLYGGFYTQQQVRDIVTYAAERFITIVPEIEMPGHAQAAIASYPALGTGGMPPAVSPDWGVHDYLFNADEATLSFLEDVLAEVIELFPSEYIHVGGDEAVKDRWRDSPAVQARIHELGLADESALQGWFVARIGRFLESRGRQLIGWDEILESGIPARAAVMSWRGAERAVAAARAGHDVVMAPAPTLYLDYLQSESASEPPGRPSIVTLEDVYRFEPVPHGLVASEARHVLGAQLNAWTEHMRLPERIEHQAFPRVAALAEVTWSPASTRDWNGFQSRLAVQFARYRALGIQYAATAFEPQPRLSRGTVPGRIRVELAKQAPHGEIRYTLDGSPPGAASPRYDAAFEAREGDVLVAGSFDGALLLGSMPAVNLTAERLRRRSDEELGQCSGRLLLRLEDDAPPKGPRAVYNVDIIDPCWTWPDADLSRGGSFRAAVGQLPFNFQIGKDADAIRRGDARTPAGELELRSGDCGGEPIAIIPLGSAAADPAVSILGPIRIPPQPQAAGLCLRFVRPAIDPIWAIQWVELGE